MKKNNESKPTITMVIQEMARLGNPLLILTILQANGRSQNSHAYDMHAKTSEGPIHATQYLQENLM